MKGILGTSPLTRAPLLLERFNVIRLLGDGAAGAVYQVEDRANGNRMVALKILCDPNAFDENTTLRFHEELRVCQKLDHPNLVRAFEAVADGDVLGFIMEYVDGSDLRMLLGKPRPSLAVVTAVFDQMLAGLEVLHSHGIWHRDIKLENILLSRTGTVKLVDLGLMKTELSQGLTRTGVRLGTLRYLPPEYIKEGVFDARGDIYGAGHVLYELLTGERRFAHLEAKEALASLIKTRFALPPLDAGKIPAPYLALLQSTLQPQPLRRCPSVTQLRADLKACEDWSAATVKSPVSGRSSQAALPTARLWPRGFSRRRMFGNLCWKGALAASLMVCLVMGFAAVSSLSSVGRLSSGSYQGFVNGISRAGSLDAAAVVVTQKELNLAVGGLSCLGPNRSGPVDISLDCGTVSYVVQLRHHSDREFAGVLQRVGAEARHAFFFQKPS